MKKNKHRKDHTSCSSYSPSVTTSDVKDKRTNSHCNILVENTGIDPVTSRMPSKSNVTIPLSSFCENNLSTNISNICLYYCCPWVQNLLALASRSTGLGKWPLVHL